MVNRFFWYTIFAVILSPHTKTSMERNKIPPPQQQEALYTTAEREKKFSAGAGALATTGAVATGVANFPWVSGTLALIACICCCDFGLRKQGYAHGVLCCCDMCRRH